MMLWIIYCRDAENISELRSLKGKEHSSYLRNGTIKLLLVGPLQNEDGKVIGSFFLIEHENYDDVKQFIQADPFAVAGIWKQVEIQAFRPSSAGSLQLA